MKALTCKVRCKFFSTLTCPHELVSFHYSELRCCSLVPVLLWLPRLLDRARKEKVLKKRDRRQARREGLVADSVML